VRKAFNKRISALIHRSCIYIVVTIVKKYLDEYSAPSAAGISQAAASGRQGEFQGGIEAAKLFTERHGNVAGTLRVPTRWSGVHAGKTPLNGTRSVPATFQAASNFEAASRTKSGNMPTQPLSATIVNTVIIATWIRNNPAPGFPPDNLGRRNI